MTGKEKIIHRVAVNSGQPMVVPRHGSFALRRSRLVRRRVRQVFYTVGIVLSLAAIGQAGYGFLTETPYLQVKPAKIDGVSGPLKKELEGLVQTYTQDKRNLVSIDSEELAAHIAQHPRVRDINVRKVYPDQLLITAVEREESAIAVTDNGFFLLDDESHVIDTLSVEELVDSKYPYIAGLRTEEVHEGESVKSPSLKNALNLLQVLEARNPSLYSKISEIEIQGDEVSALETLVAHMKSGLDIKLGDSNPVDKLPALETLLQKLSSEGIKPFEDLVYIDLSFDEMAFYMDKETALDVERKKYDDLQRLMEQEIEEYRRKHPEEEVNSAVASSSSSSERKDSAEKSSSQRTAARSTANAARTAQSYQRYANYQQSSRQYYQQQQYYQQRQYPQQQRQAAPMYNLRPANQQRY